MIFIPTLFFLLIADIVKNRKWQYGLIVVAICNLVLNIHEGTWAGDYYTTGVAVLLFLLNPFYLDWWNKRAIPEAVQNHHITAAVDEKSKRQYILEIIGWVIAVILFGMVIPALVPIDYSELVMSFGLLILISAAYLIGKMRKKSKKNITFSFIFDQDTRYAAYALFASWILGVVIYAVMTRYFVLVTTVTIVTSLLISYFIRGNSRFFAPAIAIIVADFVWRAVNILISGGMTLPYVLHVELVSVILITAGSYWLLKRPGILPIFFLSLLQMHHLIDAIYSMLSQASYFNVTIQNLTVFLIFSACWMLILPIMLLFLGWQSSEIKIQNGGG